MRSQAPVVADPSYLVGVVTYFRGWDAMLRRRNVALGVIVSFPVAMVGAGVMSRVVDQEWPLIATYGVWFVLVPSALLRWTYSPCPRCRRPFLVRWLFVSRQHAKNCVHCGLAKFTPYAGARLPSTSAAAYRRFRDRARKGLCGYCGYDLRAADSGMCAECGAPLPERPAAFGPASHRLTQTPR